VRVVVPGLSAGECSLDETASRHLVRVHRLKSGQHFVGVDPEAGLQAAGTVLSAHVRSARVRFEAPRAQLAARLPPVSLLQALGKGDKGDQVVRAATALGAAQIVFVTSERSVPKPGDGGERAARWATIAKDAARQCHRPESPDIRGPVPLADALAASTDACRVLLDPSAEVSLLSVLAQGGATQGVVVLIGPEGGLTDAEVESAVAVGFVPARFGPFVLRTELAASAALAAILAFVEE
jgi:16S rRNA (uracil1498-N3)-methyltransferase